MTYAAFCHFAPYRLINIKIKNYENDNCLYIPYNINRTEFFL